MTDKRIYWLWLTLVFGPGNPRIWQLSKHYNDAEAFVNGLTNDTVKDLTENEIKRVRKVRLSDAKKLLEYCSEENINVYCYESEGYPERLKRIANPPGVLFCYGSLDFLNDKVCIAVVGTRKPSDYSVKVTDKICRDLVKQNFILVSGFALGIDQIANTASLENNAPSIAVCGMTLDTDYPKGSGEIKKQIAKNGAVVSEYYPGYKCKIYGFSRRNRILVGLSEGVLFCECSADSHGLDNAEYAINQGKPVFAIPPHDVFDKRYFGQRNLIRNGAVSVFSSADVVYNLAYERFEAFDLVRSMGDYSVPVEDSVLFSSEKVENNRKVKSKAGRKNKSEIKEHKKVEVDYSSLSPLKQKICKVLESENLLADEIAVKTDEDISEVLSALIEMEIEGVVIALAGKMYGLN